MTKRFLIQRSLAPALLGLALACSSGGDVNSKDDATEGEDESNSTDSSETTGSGGSGTSGSSTTDSDSDPTSDTDSNPFDVLYGDGDGDETGSDTSGLRVTLPWSMSHLTKGPQSCKDLFGDMMWLTVSGDHHMFGSGCTNETEDTISADLPSSGPHTFLLSLKTTYEDVIWEYPGVFEVPENQTENLTLDPVAIVFQDLSVNWTINGEEVSCADFGAERVVVYLEQGNSARGRLLSCTEATTGRMNNLLAGTYGLSADLVDADLNTLATWNGSDEFEISSSVQTELPEIEFVVE